MITVERTYNKEAIKRIIFDPVIWDCIAEDGQAKADFEPDVDSECWLLMSVDNEAIALYNIHALNGVTAQIHAHVLPEYRKQHSRETGRIALQYIIDNTDYQKIIAVIPETYDNVIKFTMSFGFVAEGVNRKSIMKNGELIDQWMLGATRREIEWVR